MSCSPDDIRYRYFPRCILGGSAITENKRTLFTLQIVLLN